MRQIVSRVMVTEKSVLFVLETCCRNYYIIIGLDMFYQESNCQGFTAAFMFVMSRLLPCPALETQKKCFIINES